MQEQVSYEAMSTTQPNQEKVNWVFEDARTCAAAGMETLSTVPEHGGEEYRMQSHQASSSHPSYLLVKRNPLGGYMLTIRAVNQVSVRLSLLLSMRIGPL